MPRRLFDFKNHCFHFSGKKATGANSMSSVKDDKAEGSDDTDAIYYASTVRSEVKSAKMRKVNHVTV
jgi:hypothetical protein